jgi:exopolyphosphatase/guanosine-5'-triphosphate,3'-diphosphate pyrophosphatase
MLGDARHERRVAMLAERLFSLTAEWHGLSAGDVESLRLGALLHDIGRAHDDARHPEIGARIVERNRKLPLTPRQRRTAMFMTRYHRGAVPREGHDDILLKGEYPQAVVLLALLRAADALDSRSAGGAEVTITLRGRKLVLSVEPHADSPKARKALAKRKKFKLMEEILGCNVRLKVA